MRGGGTLYVGRKGGALGGAPGRDIRLSAAVLKLLTKLGAPVASGAAGSKEPLFRSRKGKHGGRLKPLAIERIVRQAARRAGIAIRVSPKSLRQAHAAHALEHGTPLELVQANLGHASIATTARYRSRRGSRPSERCQSELENYGWKQASATLQRVRPSRLGRYVFCFNDLSSASATE